MKRDCCKEWKQRSKWCAVLCCASLGINAYMMSDIPMLGVAVAAIPLLGLLLAPENDPV